MSQSNDDNTIITTKTPTITSSTISSNKRNRDMISSEDVDQYENSIVISCPIRDKYQYRTLNTDNDTRMAILPVFPSTSSHTHTEPDKIVHLLLSNVPSKIINHF